LQTLTCDSVSIDPDYNPNSDFDDSDNDIDIISSSDPPVTPQPPCAQTPQVASTSSTKRHLALQTTPSTRAHGLFKFFPVATREEHLEAIRQENLKWREQAPDAVGQMELNAKFNELERAGRKRVLDRERKRAQRLREKEKVRDCQSNTVCADHFPETSPGRFA
jgi:hypothetical protein